MMQYDLFLFDFDGLLVDTEPLHYKAYQSVLEALGIQMTWSLTHYCSVAHVSSAHLRETLNSDYPELNSYDWDTLYRAKKKAYLDLLSAYDLKIMPGANDLLQILTSKQIKHGVVTHSPREQIDAILARLPSLQSIPHFFTREDYDQPKPAPDGYLTAWKALGGERPIGFEDSVRGVAALRAAGIPAILVRPEYYPPVNEPDAEVFSSLTEIGLERFFPTI